MQASNVTHVAENIVLRKPGGLVWCLLQQLQNEYKWLPDMWMQKSGTNPILQKTRLQHLGRLIISMIAEC